MPAPSAELLAKADAAAILFLTTEVETGLSFARMAARFRDAKKARSHNVQKAKRYVQYARLAYDTVSSRLATLKCEPEQLREINLKMSELRESLGFDEKTLSRCELPGK